MNQLGLLASRRFGPLFATQFLGALNDNVFRFAIIIFVTFQMPEQDLLDNRSLVAVTAGTFILPFFFISGLAGQVADKFEKSSLVRTLKNIEIIVAALAGISFYCQSYPALLLVLFLMGTQSTFFGPLKYSLLPQHLETSELTGANGLIQAGTYAAIIIGGFIGGTMMSFGTKAAIGLTAAMCMIACLGRIAAKFIPPATANAPELKINFNPIVSGWLLIRKNLAQSGIATLIVLISIFWFMGSTYFTLIPLYGKEILGATAYNVSFLTIALAIGVAIGSLLCEKISRGKIDLGLVSIAVIMIIIVSAEIFFLGDNKGANPECTFLDVFSIQCFNRFFIDMIILGTAGALYVIPLYATLQARIERAHRARTMAALNIMNALFMVISSLFTLFLFRYDIATHSIFGLVGILNFFATSIALFFIPEILWWCNKKPENKT